MIKEYTNQRKEKEIAAAKNNKNKSQTRENQNGKKNNIDSSEDRLTTLRTKQPEHGFEVVT